MSNPPQEMYNPETESLSQDKTAWHEFLHNEEMYQGGAPHPSSDTPSASPAPPPPAPDPHHAEAAATAAAQAAVAAQAAQAAAAAVQFGPRSPSAGVPGGPGGGQPVQGVQGVQDVQAGVGQQPLQPLSPPQPPKQKRPGGPKKPPHPGKRAEQNRKAQAAFRERRDAKIKELAEQVTQLPDAQNMHLLLAQRVAETQSMVAQLKSEQDSLRQAVLALGGVPPPETPLPEFLDVNLILASHDLGHQGEHGGQEQGPTRTSPTSDETSSRALEGLMAAAIAAPRAEVNKEHGNAENTATATPPPPPAPAPAPEATS